MAYFGKEFHHEKDENLEAFVATLVNNSDITEEQAKEYLNYKPSQLLTKDGDQYTLTDGTNVSTFKSGVEFDENTGTHSCKTIITVNGDTLTQVQKYGDGSTYTMKREYSGDSLVFTMTSDQWDGVARRFYKA